MDGGVIMASPTLLIEVRVRWWLRWYLAGVKWAAALSGRAPNWPRVERWIRRGVYVGGRR